MCIYKKRFCRALLTCSCCSISRRVFIKRSSKSSSIPKSQQEVRELLYKSGFLIDRSLKDDYEFNDLPDDVSDISNSPEVKNSSVRICKLKQGNNNNQTLSNTIHRFLALT